MINMAYSADLPINTMGRRIRTRLYFTSESHLHTVLNTLRFANGDDTPSLLSDHGVSIINATPELCYLTQIVMRVFEDNRRQMNDPRRFRVEILFSPGATATPLHMHETERLNDMSRYDTAPLQMISREGLTCQEVEDFFEKVIMDGRTGDDTDAISVPPIADSSHKSQFNLDKKLSLPESVVDLRDVAGSRASTPPPLQQSASREVTATISNVTIKSDGGSKAPTSSSAREPVRLSSARSDTSDSPVKQYKKDESSEETAETPEKTGLLSRKHFWSTVAITSFVLGVGCIYMALQMHERRYQRRRWSVKRY
jgi:Histidine phosphatase superfamily (branch 2)